MRQEPVGFRLPGQLGAVQAERHGRVLNDDVHGGTVPADPVVLAEQYPSALGAVGHPLIIADLLGVVRELLSDQAHRPAVGDEDAWGFLAQTPVGEELRRRFE